MKHPVLSDLVIAGGWGVGHAKLVRDTIGGTGNPALPPPTWGGAGMGGKQPMTPNPTQGRARPRDDPLSHFRYRPGIGRGLFSSIGTPLPPNLPHKRGRSTPRNPHHIPNPTILPSLPHVGRGRGGGRRQTPTPTQGCARPRDGATTLVLGTEWRKYSCSNSTGDTANAPSRGEVGRGPAAHTRLDSGRKGIAARPSIVRSQNSKFERRISKGRETSRPFPLG